MKTNKKSIKKPIIIVLVCVSAIACLIITLISGSFILDSSTYEFEYRLTKKGLEITGSREEPHGKINIPSRIGIIKVVGIGERAFSKCDELTNVEIPHTIQYIDTHAFYWCTKLEKVIIPSSVEKVGYGAFEGCKSMTGIMVRGNGNTVIEQNAFAYCYDLVSVTIYGVKSIGKDAFSSCWSIIKVSLGDNLEEIGEGAFFYCQKLRKIKIPRSTLYIGEGAFAECSLEEGAFFEEPSFWMLKDTQSEKVLYRLDKIKLSNEHIAAEYLRNSYSYYGWTRNLLDILDN